MAKQTITSRLNSAIDLGNHLTKKDRLTYLTLLTKIGEKLKDIDGIIVPDIDLSDESTDESPATTVGTDTNPIVK